MQSARISRVRAYHQPAASLRIRFLMWCSTTSDVQGVQKASRRTPECKAYLNHPRVKQIVRDFQQQTAARPPSPTPNETPNETDQMKYLFERSLTCADELSSEEGADGLSQEWQNLGPQLPLTDFVTDQEIAKYLSPLLEGIEGIEGIECIEGLEGIEGMDIQRFDGFEGIINDPDPASTTFDVIGQLDDCSDETDSETTPILLPPEQCIDRALRPPPIDLGPHRVPGIPNMTVRTVSKECIKTRLEKTCSNRFEFKEPDYGPHTVVSRDVTSASYASKEPLPLFQGGGFNFAFSPTTIMQPM